MRGDLAKREPQMLERWYKEGLYHAIRKAKSGQKNIYSARWSSVC
ncbi:isoleucyl-tRNA synthetase [Providencia stuartii MRSN 2154]|uniref:Isoleucyl-tRNA synthetase n=1 Tax=Providencia stuartii (strain MRSN 2154) TaxID=1157951 RepID=A0A140NMY1_PROSM|nr:isoleucyl-tRNA synthetase [Providencia stuartii MRSN 2154]